MKNGKPWAAAALTAALQVLFISAAGAQSGTVPPNPVPIPQVSAPAMQAPLSPPTVSAPVLSSPAAAGTGTSAASGSAATAAGASGTKPSGTAKTAGTASSSAAKSVLPDTLDEMTSPVSLLNALSGSGTDGQGLDALSALLGGGTGLSALTGSAASGGTTANGTAADSATLAKIVALLEKQQAGAATVPKSSGAEIVRFTVNRTDIASTAAGVVSSTLAKDGSFLVTGRRPDLDETFYLFCKKTGTDKYRLFADLSQDYANEKSWMYQLVRKSPLDGTLTGDLVVFRTGDPAWALDLVIRIIGPTVPAATVR